jgi:hypothetical protein
MGWGYWGAYVFVSGYATIGFGGYLRAVTGLPAAAGEEVERPERNLPRVILLTLAAVLGQPAGLHHAGAAPAHPAGLCRQRGAGRRQWHDRARLRQRLAARRARLRKRAAGATAR